MYVDAMTTAALVAELNAQIVGGRVQKVLQVGPLSFGLEVYANRQRLYLLLTADPQSARVQLVSGKVRRGVEHPSPLGLLLRKYVDGARLIAVTQPPWERIVEMHFSGEQGDTRLIVETMDKLSNIILAVGDEILECVKRIGPKDNRYRVTLPGKPYVPPPPQRKRAPDALTSRLMEDYFTVDPDASAWRVLVDNVAGVSPLLAREVIYRSCDEAEAPAYDLSPQLVYHEFQALIGLAQSGEWSPCVVPAEDGYRAFAAYPITYLGECTPVESISAAMEMYFGAPVGADAYGASKHTVQVQIDKAVDRVQRKIESLERQAADDEKLETLRKQGELLLAYGPTLKPGQTELRAQYDPDGPALAIPVDPTLTHVENARAYFDKYEKAKRAAADVPRLLAAARRELAYLHQLMTDLALAENWPEIDMVRDALQAAGHWRGPSAAGPRGGKPGIRRFVTGDGFVIFVGRNALQNHTLITERSGPDDVWLHARDLPGSHVIVKNDGRPIPDDALEQAAKLAAYYSAGRDDSTVEVDITARRYVRPVKGALPGMVTYKNERTVVIRPEKTL